jgi:hypothetical protein
VSAALAAVLGALVGALGGYLLRAKEFRRDQRLKVYGEFMRSAMDTVHSGADLQSLAMQLGDFRQVTDPVARQTITDAHMHHGQDRAIFEESGSRLRMIASRRVRQEAEMVEDWVAVNVHGVPPFQQGFHERAAEGRASPAAVNAEAAPMAGRFADVASRDVNSWFVRRDFRDFRR